MKKRRILLGLALAAAAVFSLSACDDDKTTDTPTQQNEDQTTKYTVKFMNGTTEVQNTKVEKDATITAPATNPTKAEDVTATYTFKGWFTAATGGTQLTATTKATADVTYYAQFTATPKQYTITFMNGTTEFGTKKLNYDAVITTPDGTPEKDSDNENNYTFAGWFTAETGGTELTATTKVTGAATYYAQFTATARKYNVIFMNGSATFDTQELAYNASIVAPTTNPTKAEDETATYEFDGWYTEATGGTKVTDFGKVTENPTTFYAHYITHEKKTITFMDGADLVEEFSLAEGTQIVPPTDPEDYEDAIATYTFEGWKDEDGDLVTEFGTVTDDATFYASYTSTVKQYDIKFYNGDTELTALAAKINANTAVTKPALKDLPTQTGKRFEFWTTNTSTNIPYDFSTKITSAVTLYAVFEDETEYDTLAADTTNLFGTTFYDATIAAGSTSFDSETITLKSNSVDAVTLTAKNKVSLASANNTSFVVDLGNSKVTDTGVITFYSEVEFGGVTNGESFLQIDGSSATKSNTEIFGIRTKKDSNNKIVFGYRVDGGTDNLSAIEATTTGVFKIKVVLDTADGVADVYINGTKVFENITISVNKINGLKFTSKDGTAKTVDNVAINYEYKAENPVVTAKKAAYAVIDTYKASDPYTSLADVVKAEVDKELTAYTKSVSEATTEDAVNTIKTQIEAFVAIDKFAVTVKAYSAADVLETDATDQYIVSIKGETDFTAQLAAIKFAGYTLNGIYTDSTLTTQATSTDVVKGATLCASVTKKVAQNSYSLAWGDLDSTKALNGQTVNEFTINDSGSKISLDSSIKFGGDGSTSAANISITLAAGTYTISLKAKSGSKGNAATLAVNVAGTESTVTYASDGTESTETVEITLTDTTTIYFYRKGGKTVKLNTITIEKK